MAAIAIFGVVAVQSAAADTSPVESVSASSLPYGYVQGDSWSLNGSACGSEWCVAVGSFNVSSTQYHGLIVPIQDGVAGTGTQLPLPAGADSTQTDQLEGVSCWSSGSCVAVGEYHDTGGNIQGVVIPIVDGVIGTPQMVQPPGAGSLDPAGTDPYMKLDSVSCTASGACVAVGTYTGTSGGQLALEVPISGGIAANAVEVPAPSGATSPPNAELLDVSCQDSGLCVAVGDYYAGSSPGTEVALVVAITNGVPGTAAPMTSLPTNADSPQGAGLTNVACPATGTCSAIGYYYDSAANQRDLVVPITNGLAGNGVEALSPAGGTSPSPYAVDFDGIACQSSGACLAVGSFGVTGGATEPVAIPITNGAPADADQITLPSDADPSGQFAHLRGVACPATGSCLAVGDYRNLSSNSVPLTVTFTAGSVGAGTGTAEPTDESTGIGAFAELATVGCAAFSCAATGSYSTASGQAPFVLSAQAPLAIDPTNLPSGTVGSAYSQSLSITGAWGAYSNWSVTAGSLPAGLSLDTQTGVISGTPTVVGTSTFTVGLSSTTGVPLQTATMSYSIQIAALPPTSTPTPTPAPISGPAAAKPKPKLTLVGRSVRVTRNRFGLKLRCAAAACRGRVKLQISEVVTVKHGGRKVRKHVTVVIASARFSLAAGHTKTVKMTLNRPGRKALRVKHRLLAKVIDTMGGVKRTLGRLRLEPAPRKHKKTR